MGKRAPTVAQGDGRGNAITLSCLGCGEHHVVTLPIPASKFVKVGRDFDRLHQDCVQAKEDTPHASP